VFNLGIFKKKKYNTRDLPPPSDFLTDNLIFVGEFGAFLDIFSYLISANLSQFKPI